MEVQTKDFIITELKNRYEILLDTLKNQDDTAFETPEKEGKWSTGQHALHLIQSTEPLNKALRMPKMGLSMAFGKKNDRPERSYEQVIEKYLSKLSQGGVPLGSFAPDEIKNDGKTKAIQSLEKELGKMVDVIQTWNEDDMTTYLIPHPLIGKMTIREIMFFTIYHTEHHTKIIQERLP